MTGGRLTIGSIGLALVLTGCFGAPDSQTATPAREGTSQAAAKAGLDTPAPTSAAGAAEPSLETLQANPGQVVLTVWMPDTLYEASDAPGKQAFLDQLTAYDEQYPDIQVEVYAKRLRGPGGMLSYLKTAPPVAPSVVPDLVLVDRDALVEAARANLVVPVESVSPPSVLADVYPAALDGGTVDDTLVGLPYLVEVDHVAYRQSVISRPLQTFTQVLDSGQVFVFAGGVSAGVSPVVLLQYMAAGGTLVDEKGAPAIDAEALTSVLAFYDQAQSRRNVTEELFQLPNTAAVWAMYRDRQSNMVAVTSTQYLAGLPQVTSTAASAIPTGDGKPLALARGWSWLVVTKNPDRQTAALSLLAFLMTPANQGRYTEAAHYLPSQPSALALWESQDTGYPAFADQLLEAARVMPDSAARAAIGVAMQDSLEAVILNDVQPAQAATRAADAVRTGQGGAP